MQAQMQRISVSHCYFNKPPSIHPRSPRFLLHPSPVARGIQSNRESEAIDTNALCVIWDTPPSNSSNAPQINKPIKTQVSMTIIQ